MTRCQPCWVIEERIRKGEPRQEYDFTVMCDQCLEDERALDNEQICRTCNLWKEGYCANIKSRWYRDEMQANQSCIEWSAKNDA
jgi:hypothetical protein